MINWIKTADKKPPVGVVVLGYWPTVVMESVVLSAPGHWLAAPGFPGHKRIGPEYWAELPNLPDDAKRGE